MPEGIAIQAKVTWTEGLQFVGSGGTSGATVLLGGGPQHGGPGMGVRPVEALLISLAGCTGMDVISILRKKRQRVTSFHVNVRGLQEEEHPHRFIRVELEYVVRGEDVSEKAVARSIELSLTKYCSVTASLNCDVEHAFRLEQG